jgi:hypothetical protein
MRQQLSLTALALVLGLASYAQAQPPSRYSPGPAFSPYLNLFRQGTNPAINYYGIVRPEIDFRTSIQGLQQDVGALTAPPTGHDPGATQALPPTGHTPRFQNYGTYYGRSLTTGLVTRSPFGRYTGAGTTGGTGTGATPASGSSNTGRFGPPTGGRSGSPTPPSTPIIP